MPAGASPSTPGSHAATDSDTNTDHTLDNVLEKEGDTANSDDAVANDSKDYDPVTPKDRGELTRLASNYSAARRASLERVQTNASARSRMSANADVDTLYNLDFEDAHLDPSSPKFNVYKWARAYVKGMQEQGSHPRQTGFVFKNLDISGSGSSMFVQHNVASILGKPVEERHYSSRPQKRILRNFNGVVKTGEMLVVLGRPGSGCSTFLKTICGEQYGLKMGEKSVIHYNGIPQKTMVENFKGDIVYNGETDKHFPHLTVGQTLRFAAAVRTPHIRIKGESREWMIDHMVEVIMTVLGLSHTRDTKVGNAYIRGVSGGERKRVSIAEMALSRAPMAAWDNSSRGLDSATALEFIRALRITSDVAGMTHAVAIYQASQAIYDKFEKATVLYEGRQIYFGPANKAKAYFERMGWYCPPRQTTGDFLTSVTNPMERKPREGFENRVPRTPDDFEKYWFESPEYAEMMKEIEDYEKEYPLGGRTLQEFQQSHHELQAKHTKPGSPYMISTPMQIKLCVIRTYQRIWGDKTSTITRVIGQCCMAVIVGSIYLNTADDTDSFNGKGAVTFFAVLLNSLIAVVEIFRLYEQRPIVEKQATYAFYRPFTEALGSWIAEVPIKTVTAIGFNTALYFLAGLRKEPSQFFIFLLFNWLSTITMQCIFRTLGSLTKSVEQAMAMAGVMMLALVIYTGFVIPPDNMHPWFRWINYINPIAYAYESILTNEFHGRNFQCASSSFVPPYSTVSGTDFVCAIQGAQPGETFVRGDAFMKEAYGYHYSHTWRNFGIIVGFTVFFLITYLVASEYNSLNLSKPDVLVFRRGKVPTAIQEASKSDDIARVTSTDQELVKLHTRDENIQQEQVNMIPPQKDIFTWRNVCYDIPFKGEMRRLLRNVDGWVIPGTLTALMGASGAGKTTLLDVLAQRKDVGVVTGDMFVNGKPLNESFPRQTGYVQQLDLHLETTTVREALRFSAMLRQPRTVSKKEKYDYVEDVIRMLRMEEFAEAVVGIPGEGLNVEQRKLLTIGVELAAKPALLLFLDEPTSGLDSQSSWSIISFLRRLADHGQAVLATIHQPSAILFQEFDRLLLLTSGGRTVYFGDVGEESRTMLDYFESHGGRACDPSENPAEYMLEVIGGSAGGHALQDWHEVWRSSKEYQEVQKTLDRIHEEKKDEPVSGDGLETEFAMPLSSQLWYVSKRVFQQYWRSPNYIWGKYLLGVISGIFNAFSFYKPGHSEKGMQDVLFSVFMLISIFSAMAHQIMPRFVMQRELYEVRERPSKAYSWKAFMTANIFVEFPYQILLGILVFACYYYPVFGIQSSSRQGIILLYCIQYYVYLSTFSHLLIASMPDEETAGIVCTLMFAMSLVFNGIMQPPDSLPNFWMFMFYVSPFTYWCSGLIATGMHDRGVQCASNELAVFTTPTGSNLTCQSYLSKYFEAGAPGYLVNPNATQTCEYCSLTVSDQILSEYRIYWSDRWRNFGIVWAYVVFDIVFAVLTYYWFRVRTNDIARAKLFVKRCKDWAIGKVHGSNAAPENAVAEKGPTEKI